MEYKYIITGTSRSGKSTVVKFLEKKINKDSLDIVDYVYDFIKREKISQKENKHSLLRIPYDDLYIDLRKGKKWGLLEIASDFPGEFVPMLLSTSKNPIKLIYCKCPVEICLKRNKKEKRKVPEKIIKIQGKFDENYYRALASKLEVELIVLDTNLPIKKTFKNLLQELDIS